MNILGILLGYLSATFIHEVAHFITFRLKRIEIRALYIWPLILYKKDKKWHFKLRQINALTFGGIVIPDLHIIKNDSTLNRIRKDFQTVMIAAPITNIIFSIIVGLLHWFNPFTMDEKLKIIGLFYFLGLSMGTVFITLTSCIKGNGVYGDYAAYMMLKKDKYFVAYIAYQYLYFSSDNHKELYSFLREKVAEGIKEAYDKEHFRDIIFDCINTIVTEYLTGKIKTMPIAVHQYITLVLKRYKQLLIYKNNEALRVLLYNLVVYYYRGLNDRSSAIKLHHYLEQSIYLKNKVCTYYHKRNQYILGIENHSFYLMDPKNIINGMMYQLTNLFDEYYKDEWSIIGYCHL